MPFLIGLAAASNIGSAATIIGNPQNMLLGQVGKLDFVNFSRQCLPPVLLALAGAYVILLVIYRRQLPKRHDAAGSGQREYPAFNRHQTVKGMTVIVVLVVLFLTGLPRELSAIALAGFLLCSRRMKTRSLLGLVDWHLITLFCALFIVMAGIEAVHIPRQIMDVSGGQGGGFGPHARSERLDRAAQQHGQQCAGGDAAGENTEPGPALSWVVVALASTFAGNLITIGSIANLIVIESAREYGVTIRFGEHARAGVPITLFSLLIIIIWLG